MTDYAIVFNRTMPSANELLHKKQGFVSKTGQRFYPYTGLKKQWAKLAYNTWLVTFGGIKISGQYEVAIRAVRKSRTYFQDSSNLILSVDKMIIDGLVEAGVLPGDDPEHLTGWRTTQEKGFPEYTEVTIRQKT